MSISAHKISNRISWVLWSRVVFLGVMATSAVCLNLVYGDSIKSSILWAILLGLGFSVLSRFALYFPLARFGLLSVAYAQLVADSILTSFLVSETGGLHSAFILLYGLNIIAAGVVLFTRGVVTALALSLVGYVYVGLSEISLNAPTEIARLIFVCSILILVAGLVSILFRNRESLVRSLEKTSSDLQSLMALQSSIVDHIPVGLLVVGPKNQILFSNPAAKEILGSNYTHQASTELPIQTQGLVGEQEFEHPVKGVRSLLVENISIDSMRNLVVLTDISSLRSLELEVRVQEKLAGVGQLAAGLAHEIKNPLASLSGSIQMLQSESQTEEYRGKLMEIIMRETDRLDELLNGFLNYAKPSQLRVENVEARAVIEDVFNLIQSQNEFRERIQFKLQCEEKTVVQCDPSKLRQVIWNLTTNAAGSISGQGEVSIRLRSLDDKVRIEIQDTGSGIPKEIQSRVFEPFFTRKARGTGLGLAMVYQIVQAHGGQVGFQSQDGVGTTFWVEFASGRSKDQSAA